MYLLASRIKSSNALIILCGNKLSVSSISPWHDTSVSRTILRLKESVTCCIVWSQKNCDVEKRKNNTKKRLRLIFLDQVNDNFVIHRINFSVSVSRYYYSDSLNKLGKYWNVRCENDRDSDLTALIAFLGWKRERESESSSRCGRFARTTRLSQIRINELHTPWRGIGEWSKPDKGETISCW